MNLITKALSKSLTEVTADQLKGATYIRNGAFYSMSSLKKITIPATIEQIGTYAFDKSTNISDVNLDDMNPYVIIGPYVSSDEMFLKTSSWFKNHPDSMIYASSNRILISNKIASPSSYTIPDTVVNLGPGALSLYSGTSSLTSAVIPDTVEIVQSHMFNNHSSLTKITVGASVRYIGSNLTPGTQTTTLIFRQPAGMYIELPIPGDSLEKPCPGMAYNKSSRNVSIYTDNEYIRNYDWATDGVTATFYPLSQAPA